ncbi:Phage regulatory protein Rha [anaerobic digester metagenome]
MKELIPMDTYGVFADTHDTARANSLQVAEYFEKHHDKVVRDIEALDCSEEFNTANFGVIKYTDSRGRKQKAYAMTRDGFMFLVMGYRGKKAAAIKEAYIRRFNQMENTIRSLVETRQEFPLLTANIQLIHEHPMPYHFSNEADMLNRVAIGQTAKQFREARGLKKHESIRPYLTDDQIKLLDTLQKVDIGLLVAFSDYDQRKRQLEWYRDRMLGRVGISA